MASELAVSVSGLTKVFKIPLEQRMTTPEDNAIVLRCFARAGEDVVIVTSDSVCRTRGVRDGQTRDLRRGSGE